LDLLEQSDKEEAAEDKKSDGGKRDKIDKSKIKEKLTHYTQSKARYEDLKVKLAESGDIQISTTDPNAWAIVSGTGCPKLGIAFKWRVMINTISSSISNSPIPTTKRHCPAWQLAHMRY
jgi:hypothetical protein